MTDVVLTELEPNVFGAEVTEGAERTGHRVFVPPDLLDQLGLVDVDRAEVAREAIGFLLDRVPADAIGEDVSLYDLAHEYADFTDELLARLT